MLLVVVSAALFIFRCASKAIPAPVLQCPGRDDSVQREIVRHGLYQYFNYMRHGIATGVDMFKNVTLKNETRLMYAIKYDCELESIASEALRNTSRTPPKNHVGLKYESHKPGGEFLGSAEIQQALDKWKTNRLAKYLFLYPFVPLFGCAYSYENKKLKLNCIFRTDSPEETYERLPSCQEDSDCKRYPNSTCGYNLCWAPFGL